MCFSHAKEQDILQKRVKNLQKDWVPQHLGFWILSFITRYASSFGVFVCCRDGFACLWKAYVYFN